MPIVNADGLSIHYMSADEVSVWTPYDAVPSDRDPKALLRDRLEKAGQWHPNQIAGRRWSIGCVALEITQRCNLDCSLCYLSDHSEAVRDLPLQEVFRRIDMIREHFGPDTDVQVTGGDPTLRSREDLIAIVRRLRSRQLRPSLFTNGILASRELLASLTDAGLVDVAFHVDLTQERKGYATEQSLNELRLRYIERTRGLRLSVFFNTTIFAGNFAEVPMLVKFFTEHSDRVRLASFQLQADTGRGVLRERPDEISPATVIARINQAAGADLCFHTLAAGHTECNRYTMALVIDGQLLPCYDRPELAVPLMQATAKVAFDRTRPQTAAWTALRALIAHPLLWIPLLKWLAAKAWAARVALWRARGRVGKLSFFVHNFMDGCRLDRERIEACTFLTATAHGPVSMCMHNAQRDQYILAPVAIEGSEGTTYWDPLSGQCAAPTEQPLHFFPLKSLRGRRATAWRK